MASTTVTRRSPRAWIRIAFAMFAVGWGANQFSPMLIVYRHELRLTAGEVAGLFLVYALPLIPGLLVGGPASDRFGRRPVVWPFVALSPLATLLLVLGPRSLALLAVGRALAGLCSGVVFGAATAWVQDVSPDRGPGNGPSSGLSVRRSALALTGGFGLGPVVAAVLAQWAGRPAGGAVPAAPGDRHGGRGRAGRDARGCHVAVAGTGPVPCSRDDDTTLAAGRGPHPPVLAGGRAGQPAGVRLGGARDRGAARGSHQRADPVRPASRA